LVVELLEHLPGFVKRCHVDADTRAVDSSIFFPMAFVRVVPIFYASQVFCGLCESLQIIRCRPQDAVVYEAAREPQRVADGVILPPWFRIVAESIAFDASGKSVGTFATQNLLVVV
jgi:hypothetical protein